MLVLPLVLAGLLQLVAADVDFRSTCDEISYGYCRLDEGNVYTSERLKGFAKLDMEICQRECTLDSDCHYFLWERETCRFLRDPEQYFATCRDVAGSPHLEFSKCFYTNQAAGCSRADLGPKKLSNCKYDGRILERMPADDMLVCERACTLRTTREIADHCKFFIYNQETRECQLLANSEKTCYMQLGPKMEKRACFFSALEPVVLAEVNHAPSTQWSALLTLSLLLLSTAAYL